jgi:putative DNA primase/helicase
MNNEVTQIDHALAYAAYGWPVFPVHGIEGGRCTCGKPNCKRPGKHPRTRHGFKDATTDPNRIRQWWKEWPNSNIGIATGVQSGLIVLDVDGEKGEAKLAAMITERGPPLTPQAKTGRGRHLYFALPPDVSVPSSENGGLDIKCEGGYVVAPPSIHPTGNMYQWVGELTAPTLAPDWIIKYARGDHTPDPAAPLASSRPQVCDQLNLYADPPPYSEAEEVRIWSMLRCIPALSYDDWLHVGMALHWLGWGERGYQIWCAWSRTVPEKYDESTQREKWESFNRSSDRKPITLGTLVHMAKAGGWTDTAAPALHTDLGNARRLVARHGRNIRFIHEWRKWIVWDDTRWCVDDDGAIMRLAKETVEALFVEAANIKDEDKRKELRKHAMRCQAAARLDAMIDLATSEPEVVLSAQRLDADPWLLGTQNGVLELRTGKFRPAERGDYITMRMGAAFDPEATCANFLEFLKTITGGDQHLAAYLQRAVGYMLTGSTCEEVMFVTWGIGNNGKSTWCETLHTLFGDYAMTADAGLLMERKTPGGATPEIARLKGRRFVAINETAENEHLNEARVKFVTSHDKITARKLYQDFFDFDPTHKIVLKTNHKPIVRGTDIGIWRRIHLLPFTVTIPSEKVEKYFRERRLIPELPGILNWALEGLRAYLREGLNPPAAVQAATGDYQRDMDVVGQWIDQQCVLDPQAAVPTGAAYVDYTQWAQDEIAWALTKLKFRRNLTDRGFEAGMGAGGQRLIRGLKLKKPSGLYMLPVGAERSSEPRGQAPGGGAPVTTGVRFMPPRGR